MIGLVNLLKPPGITSNHALIELRKVTGERYSGHAGTLDPEAAGVLPILLGKAARLLDYLPDYKEYIAEITFGFITNTLDCEGEVLARSDVVPSLSEIINALYNFTGEITQVPPAFSAIKQNGVPLYKLARQGVEVDIKPRSVKIYELTYLSQTGDVSHRIKIACSKGTYIRTLCAQIGEYLGTLATMTCLIRTASGSMRIDDSISISEIISEIETGNLGFILPPDEAVSHLPEIRLHESLAKKAANGNRLACGYKDTEIARLYCGDVFLGLASVKDGLMIPKVLLFTPEELIK